MSNTEHGCFSETLPKIDASSITPNGTPIDRLFRMYRRQVFRYAYSLLRNKQDSEDVVSRVFLSLYQGKLHQLNPQNESRFLMGVTRNHVRWYIRDENPTRHAQEVMSFQLQSDLLADPIDPFTEVLGGNTFNTNDIVSVSVATFNLSMEGQSYEEISRLLKIPIGTVKSRVYNARRMLREAYASTITQRKNSYLLMDKSPFLRIASSGKNHLIGVGFNLSNISSTCLFNLTRLSV